MAANLQMDEGYVARVLIVEDDPASMDLALRIVRLEKHEPITTADGETALALARAVRPDLILLDLHIPKLAPAAKALDKTIRKNAFIRDSSD